MRYAQFYKPKDIPSTESIRARAYAKRHGGRLPEQDLKERSLEELPPHVQRLVDKGVRVLQNSLGHYWRPDGIPIVPEDLVVGVEEGSNVDPRTGKHVIRHPKSIARWAADEDVGY